MKDPNWERFRIGSGVQLGMTIDVVRVLGTVTETVPVHVVPQEDSVVIHTTTVNYLSNLISVKTPNSSIQVPVAFFTALSRVYSK